MAGDIAAATGDDADLSACLECGAKLAGPYCHLCGHNNRPQALPMRALVSNALAESFSLEGRTLLTADAMLRRPGELLVAFREGRGHRYTTPFKLFLIVSAAFFLFLIWTDVAIYQFLPVPFGDAPITAELVPGGVRLVNATLQDIFLFPRAGPEVQAEAIAALNTARTGADKVQIQAIDDFIQYQRAWEGLNETLETWLPRLLWLLMPVYGLMLWPLFSPSRRLLVEHFVFALWAHSMIFILLMLLAAMNWMGVRLSFWLLALPYLAYFILAARRYYEVSAVAAAWRGVVHLLAFFLLIWSPIALTIAWSSAANDIPNSFWIADVGPGLTTIDRWVLPPPVPPAP